MFTLNISQPDVVAMMEDLSMEQSMKSSVTRFFISLPSSLFTSKVNSNCRIIWPEGAHIETITLNQKQLLQLNQIQTSNLIYLFPTGATLIINVLAILFINKFFFLSCIGVIFVLIRLIMMPRE